MGKRGQYNLFGEMGRHMGAAEQWAAQQGHTSAQKLIIDLRNTMSRRQIAEAESRAKAFRPVATTRR